jgi:hypothetical protein
MIVFELSPLLGGHRNKAKARTASWGLLRVVLKRRPSKQMQPSEGGRVSVSEIQVWWEV